LPLNTEPRQVTYFAEIFSSSIVAVGAFNPAIFSPDWLEKYGLIGGDDAETARKMPSLIISQQVSVVETDWFVLQVLDNQFSLQSKNVLSPALKDLASGIFMLVSHTPISALGLNFMGHFRFLNNTDYHKIGDVLAPKDIWKSLYPSENDSAGLADLTIRIQHAERDKQPETGNEIRITVQPSTKIRLGIFLSLNDHREVRANEADNQTAADVAARIVAEDWQTSWDDSTRAFDGLISMALAN
jgi:hypothetical protein